MNRSSRLMVALALVGLSCGAADGPTPPRNATPSVQANKPIQVAVVPPPA